MTNTADADKQLHPFIKNEWLKTKRDAFMVKILFIIAGYTGITLGLNAIRATAPLWFVWLLIIIQLILYFSIFTVSYLRAKECGFKRFSFVILLILSVLGRVENWELVIIPVLLVIMLVISARNKNLLETNTL
ncbi:hypothetical protein GYA19_01940 [Candidatus Beckwithbacteria bacterium]|nr:hypothetical protein [Candidatus Beckwithbacteria bacterium]